MIRVLAILDDSVIIISNESTASRFEHVFKETPVRFYYDGLFNYSFARRTLLCPEDSIKYTDSLGLGFNTLLGLTISQSGNVYTHILCTREIDEGNKIEQIAEFQGMIQSLTNSWFGGDTYIINALSMVWEQSRSLDPEMLFEVLAPSPMSSVSLTISTIKKDALLKSIEMINSGMPLSSIAPLWDVKQYDRAIAIKHYEPNEIQEFNTHNLSQLTAYHTIPNPVE